MGKRRTLDYVIEKSHEIHGDKYIFTESDFVNMHTKMKIICPIHGEFFQTPHNHIDLKQGCPYCSGNAKLTNESFKEKAKKIHGDKYNYDKVNVNGTHRKVIITCPIHGDFEQAPNDHLHGQGCPECGKDKIWDTRGRLTVEEVKEAFRKVHGDKYNYDKFTEYKNNRIKIPIICEKHGTFYMTVDNHLQGHGCPICRRSNLEKNIAKLLEENDIEYEEEKRFPWLKQYELDFYLPQYNIAIECQGRQHFEPIDFFGGEETFTHQLERDEDKYNLCKENGVEVFYVAEDSVLDKYLHSYPHKLYSCSVGLLNEVIRH